MYSSLYSATLIGVEGLVVRLEAALSDSTPKVQITGLPSDIVKESSERVIACLRHFGFQVPSSRTVIHLSPADARKHGPQFDVALALSILGAEKKEFSPRLRRMAFLGEIRIDGQILPVPGAVGLAEALERHAEIDLIVVPAGNEPELRFLKSSKLRLAHHLREILDFLHGKAPLAELSPALPVTEAFPSGILWDRVVGQRLAKRALQVALAGHHHTLLIGPPGAGKSMLAQACEALLPPLESAELIRVMKNHGASLQKRPFRSPHHSISAQGLLGGGSGVIVPGEVTLADSGILFLDELPEFRRDALEGLREPLQEGRIFIHRVGKHHCLPAHFLLVATLNPCPCGMSLSQTRCRCGWERVLHYRRRISGPILDRIALGIVLAPSSEVAVQQKTFTQVRESILRARQIQTARSGLNGEAAVNLEDGPFVLDSVGREWCEKKLKESTVSLRAIHHAVRVARTLADLEEEGTIQLPHLREAWSLRCPDLFTPRW